MSAKRKRWFKLDNAAKLYPAIATARWSSVFRVGVLMKEPIVPSVLQQALNKTLPRFPALKVRIKPGFFWYYFEENMAQLPIMQEEGHPCMPFRFKDNHGYLLRVVYNKRRVSVEFFHALTDGTGGMTFLKTLICCYLKLLGKKVCYDAGALDLADAPKQEEFEDAFKRMPLPKIRASRKETRAYHLPATKELPHTLNVVAATMPCDQVLALAHSMHITLTEYIASAMVYTIYQEAKKDKHPQNPIRISIPINMRTYFKTRTLRNFSSFVNPGIDPRLGEYTFEEIAQTIHAFLQYYNNPKLLGAMISANVKDESNLLIRLCPLPLKNFVIGRVFRASGEKLFSTTLTNLGRVVLPTGTEEYVEHLEMLLGGPATAMAHAAMLSSGNDLQIYFTDNIQEKTLPRGVLRFLVQQGIPVTVESNRE